MLSRLCGDHAGAGCVQESEFFDLGQVNQEHDGIDSALLGLPQDHLLILGALAFRKVVFLEQTTIMYGLILNFIYLLHFLHFFDAGFLLHLFLLELLKDGRSGFLFHFDDEVGCRCWFLVRMVVLNIVLEVIDYVLNLGLGI